MCINCLSVCVRGSKFSSPVIISGSFLPDLIMTTKNGAYLSFVKLHRENKAHDELKTLLKRFQVNFGRDLGSLPLVQNLGNHHNGPFRY